MCLAFHVACHHCFPICLLDHICDAVTVFKHQTPRPVKAARLELSHFFTLSLFCTLTTIPQVGGEPAAMGRAAVRPPNGLHNNIPKTPTQVLDLTHATTLLRKKRLSFDRLSLFLSSTPGQVELSLSNKGCEQDPVISTCRDTTTTTPWQRLHLQSQGPQSQPHRRRAASPRRG